MQSVGNGLGLDVQIKAIENPRKEKEEHYYNPKHVGLLELGLNPHFLSDEVLAEMFEQVCKHADRIHAHKVFQGTKW